MKLIFFLLCSVLGASQILPSQKINDREREGLKGQAKRVFETWSPLSAGWGIDIGAHCRKETQEYDPQGRLTLRVLYPGSCGSEEIRESYSYDQAGNALEGFDASQASGIRPTPKTPTTSTEETPQGSYTVKHTFKYDAQGRKTSASTYKPNGKLLYQTLYIYDSKGRSSGEESQGADGKRQGKVVFTYEGAGQYPTGALHSGANGKPYARFTYSEYQVNSRGDWVQRKEVTERLDNPKLPKTVALVYRAIDYY